MYEIFTANTKTEKRLLVFIKIRKDITEKLKRLKLDPRTELDAHPLYGRLDGKWSCWLGSNIRMIYSIDDINKKIII